jgi:hypothetical protein
MAIDGVLVPIVMFSMVPVVAIGMPIARAFARRLESKPTTAIPADVAARLERMEQAIDSIAVEVERISEGQRFTTKLLAERVPAPPTTAATALGSSVPPTGR